MRALKLNSYQFDMKKERESPEKQTNTSSETEDIGYMRISELIIPIANYADT